MSNKYKKYAPNVFLAECDEKHQKGDIIEITTRHGKVNEHIVHNFIFETREGKFLYSITRADGFNAQKRAEKKREKYEQASDRAMRKSSEARKASNEGRDFLALGEPIKVGHHSEKRHRALIERNDRRMRKAREEEKRADELKRKAEYWESMENVINLSMPESVEFFEFKLRKAKEKQQGLKDGTIKREHSFSLQYATKEVKELEKKLNIAITLWGEKG